MSDTDECTGAGNCHGCLKWCSVCGDVTHTCDMRLRGERCDEHPIPPKWPTLRAARKAAEREIDEAREKERSARARLEEVADAENARRAYDQQLEASERVRP